jgi:hypothetical protein
VKVAYSSRISRATLNSGGIPAAYALWEDVIAGLRQRIADEGLAMPPTIDCRIEDDTDVARAIRQEHADAQADADGVERWTVPELVTFRAEADAEPLETPT